MSDFDTMSTETPGFDHELTEAEFRNRILTWSEERIVANTMDCTATLCLFLTLAAKLGRVEFAKNMALADFKRALAALDRDADNAVKYHVEGTKIVRAAKREAAGVPEGVEVL